MFLVPFRSAPPPKVVEDPVQTTSANALQTWVVRTPWRSPHADRSGLQSSAHAVLVVDDDLGVLRLTAKMLRLEGYRVLEAGSGSEALRLLDSEPSIGVVVTDVVMPGMHGLELAGRIMQRERSPRVVLMTGHAAELSVQLEHRDASLPLLLKPFTSQQLIKTVRGALDGDRH
jgi:DNA-binding NtrC family response regulator